MDITQEAGLLAPHDLPGGTVRAMAEHGHIEVGYRDELTTRMPTPEEAQTLGPVYPFSPTCAPGTPRSGAPAAAGVRTCSGRTPRPTRRAGTPCRTG
jgi:hypothetical protein